MKILARKGDTIENYSRMFNVPEKLLLDSNPEISTSVFIASEAVNIPGWRKIAHRLKEGDTLANMAASSGFHLDVLTLLNQQRNLTGLDAEGIIYLPEKAAFPQIIHPGPYDYRRLLLDIEQLKEIYPFLSFNQIGESVLGKPIHEIRIGRGPKKVHMNASFHANEWITSLVLMNLVESYLLSLTNGYRMDGMNPLSIYHQIELSIVPMVNPDGVDLAINGPPSERAEEVLEINGKNTEFVHWKANIRGIDLNNQYPAKWEVEKERKLPKSPAPRDYPGDLPLTEPEAIAMANLAIENSFDCIVAFHTQGKEFYWGYEGFETVEAEEIALEIERRSGYKAVRYVDSHAGYKDWFIQEFGKPGYTIELGKGINPLPLSQLNQILSEAGGVFLAIINKNLPID